MELWIPITIGAAFAQTLRFMAQKHLKATTLSTAGATWARFFYSAPLVAVIITAYLTQTDQPWPAFSPAFWAYAMIGGAAQILATMCVVALFAYRNFAVGITFKKTEVMLTAIAGYLVLGEVVSFAGGLAILVGFFGVLWLSEMPDAQGPLLTRLMNRAAGLGILSGVFFAISAVGYRGATLEIASDDILVRAGVTLAIVTASQTLALGLWLGLRESGQIRAVIVNWRIAGLVGFFSMLGSFGWFTAFTLQSAGYVFALGQVELIFSLIASVLFYQERISPREYVGMGLLTVSIITIAFVT
jgi:drug/metabolite transporter (DMT)-like permease